MLVLSNDTGWIEHALGLGGIVEMRGPQAFIDGSPHSLFETNRFMIILASLAVSKATFLSQPEWKTIPWSKDPASKVPIHVLMDIFADLASLKEQRDQDHANINLRDKAIKAISGLLMWRQTWDSTPNGMITEIICPRSEASPFQFFRSTLQFTSMHAAICTCLFDASLILAVELLTSAFERQPPFPPTPNDLSILHNNFLASARAAAVEICQSIAFQLSGTIPMTGQFLVMFPLRMAWKALGGSATIEGHWIEHQLAEFEKGRQQWGVLRKIITY